MSKESYNFFKKLLATPSPTGYEQKIQKVVKTRMSQYADSIKTDLHGNVIVSLNEKAPRKIMLAGHCDQIGFMVRYIADNGFIYLTPLGGIDLKVLQGSTVLIHNRKGKVKGLIGKTPIHHEKPEDRKKLTVNWDSVWVDIGAKDRKQAEKKVELGDPVTFELNHIDFDNGMIGGPGIDNKAGVFVVMEALRLCKGKKLNFGVYAVSTVQEEVGLRGAGTSSYGINPEVGIAVDVTHASDNPGYTKKNEAPVVLGNGPVLHRGPSINPVVDEYLQKTAKKNKIKYQISPGGRLLPNDTSAIQVARAGVACGCISIPNRYMHTQVEMCSFKDLQDAAKLIAKFIQDLPKSANFTPR